MKDHAIFKMVLAKQASEFVKSMKQIKSGQWTDWVCDISQTANSLHEVLSVFSDFFSGTTPAEANETLHYLTHKLEEVREEDGALEVLRAVLAQRQGAYAKSLANFAVITASDRKRFSEEFQLLRNHAVEKARKELLRVKAPIIQKALMQDCAAARTFEYRWFLKRLNERREVVFNRIVAIIRSAKSEELSELRAQVEKFACLVLVAVKLGYQKGKKSVQVLNALRESLNMVHDEEVLRLAIQDLEKARIAHPERVGDVQKLRLIRSQLGIRQAQSLRTFHQNIPPCLQVLKRQMVTWK